MVFVLKKQCNVRHAGIWLHAKSQQAHSWYGWFLPQTEHLK
jgi:hypothetical protein